MFVLGYAFINNPKIMSCARPQYIDLGFSKMFDYYNQTSNYKQETNTSSYMFARNEILELEWTVV